MGSGQATEAGGERNERGIGLIWDTNKKKIRTYCNCKSDF